MRQTILGACAFFAPLFACGSNGNAAGAAAPPIDLGDMPAPDVDAGGTDASWPVVDGGFVVGDAGLVRADRFVTKLVSYEGGACAGFGQGAAPGIIEGPPVGGGSSRGSLDVLSLGNGGSLVVSFDPNAIVDGPGVDFIVFENPFLYGSPPRPYAEPGVVSVSDDGVNWTSFSPCTATNASGGPYGSCAGWSPVYSSPENGISPFDPSTAGGNAFDLHDVGVARARYVKIVDQGGEPCLNPAAQITNGFDLDAIAIVNAEMP
jgi:hypothetical protein